MPVHLVSSVTSFTACRLYSVGSASLTRDGRTISVYVLLVDFMGGIVDSPITRLFICEFVVHG